MFSILMKHEIKQTFKALLLIIGAVILVVAVAVIPIYLRAPVLGEFGMVAAMISLSVLPWALLGYLVGRYYRSMYGQVGYFTMSLPVSGRMLYVVKVSWALAVGIVGYLIMALGLAAVSAIKEGLSLGEMISRISNGMGWWVLGVFIVLGLLGLVATIAEGAFAVTYGSQARFSHLGLGGPVLIGVIMYLVNGIVVFAALLFIPLGLSLDPSGGGKIVAEGMLPSLVAASSGSATPPVIGLGAILAFVLLALVCSIWTTRSIERHTSLR